MLRLSYQPRRTDSYPCPLRLRAGCLGLEGKEYERDERREITSYQ